MQILFVLGGKFRPYLVMLRAQSCLFLPELCLLVLRRPYGILGTKTRMATCKANDLPKYLALLHQLQIYFVHYLLSFYFDPLLYLNTMVTNHKLLVSIIHQQCTFFLTKAFHFPPSSYPLPTFSLGRQFICFSLFFLLLWFALLLVDK